MSILKRIHCSDKSNNGFYTKKYKARIPYSFAYKVVFIDDRFSKPVVLYRGKNAVIKFIEAILKENKCCKKMIKSHFNKNLVTSVEDERSFKSSNNYNELFAAEDSKVRDHDHVTVKEEVLHIWVVTLILNLLKIFL